MPQTIKQLLLYGKPLKKPLFRKLELSMIFLRREVKMMVWLMLRQNNDTKKNTTH